MDDAITPERYELLCDLVEQAESQSETDRTSFLRTACNDDDDLFARAVEIVAARHRMNSEGFLPASAPVSVRRLTAEVCEELTGQRVGHFRVEELIAVGGMGAVYRGSRMSDFKQTVAIKVIRPGMGTNDVVARFQNERQILAKLQHVNVAMLLDGGSTSNGRPYFVMEFIDGVSITEFCKANHLSVVGRLRLFQQALAGVQAAHQMAVLHRDLKPSNMLVVSPGLVKLVDFGIAKLIEPQDQGEPPLHTRPEDRALTPEYASPEQARGEIPTTASDIYSLGVVLYEILVGDRPYSLAGLSNAQWERVICEKTPAAPSEIIAQRMNDGDSQEEGYSSLSAICSERSCTAAQLRRQLRSDIDTIVLKALQKESTRRYATVEQFAADIDRYLGGLPVLARPDTRWYRMQKFARRNKVAVGIAVLFVLALITGLIGTSWGLARAVRAESTSERRFDDVRELATTAVFDIHDKIRALPGSTPVRMHVVNTGLTYLDKLEREGASDRPDFIHELAKAYIRAGDTAGHPYASSLGQHEVAFAAYTKADRLMTGILSVDPTNGDYRATSLMAQGSISDLRALDGDVETAYRSYEKLVEQASDLVEKYSDQETPQRVYAGFLMRASEYAATLGDWDAARAHASSAVEFSRTLIKRMPGNTEAHRHAYRAIMRQATIQANLGELDQAIKTLEDADLELEQLKSLGAASKADFSSRLAFGSQLAMFYRSNGQFVAARQILQEVLPSLREFSAEDPQDISAQCALADGEIQLAVLTDDTSPQETLARLQEARRRLQPFASELNVDMLTTMIQLLHSTAACHALLRQNAEAEKAYLDAVQIVDDYLTPEVRNVKVVVISATASQKLADFYWATQRPAAGIKAVGPALELLEEHLARFKNDYRYQERRMLLHSSSADLYAADQQWDRAIASAESSLAIARELAKSNPTSYPLNLFVLNNWNRLGTLHYQKSLSGKGDKGQSLAEAKRYFELQGNRWRVLIVSGNIPMENRKDARERLSTCQTAIADLTADLALAAKDETPNSD
jgi:serine/threonine protein kinase/tetratricopeptide (TPR) repeat protein